MAASLNNRISSFFFGLASCLNWSYSMLKAKSKVDRSFIVLAPNPSFQTDCVMFHNWARLSAWFFLETSSSNCQQVEGKCFASIPCVKQQQDKHYYSKYRYLYLHEQFRIWQYYCFLLLRPKDSFFLTCHDLSQQQQQQQPI